MKEAGGCHLAYDIGHIAADYSISKPSVLKGCSETLSLPDSGNPSSSKLLLHGNHQHRKG